MNALFGRVIKVFLALHKAKHAIGQDDGNGAQRRDIPGGGLGMVLVGVHIGLYRPVILLSQYTEWQFRIGST